MLFSSHFARVFVWMLLVFSGFVSIHAEAQSKQASNQSISSKILSAQQIFDKCKDSVMTIQTDTA